MRKTRRAAVAGTAWHMYRETRGESAPGFGARLRAVPRMFRAVLTGRYKGLSVSRFGLMLMSMAYIVSPIDAIPDMIPILGVADDLGVGLWLMSAIFSAAGDYVRWERKSEPVYAYVIND